jgi:hypothetical protein
MTTKDKPSKQKKILSSEMLIQRRIKETKALIEINQSIKGISWEETEIPTLTNMADKDSQELEVSGLGLIDDSKPEKRKPNGHKPNCTCIKCSPKNGNKSSPILNRVEIEAHDPFNKKKYE